MINLTYGECDDVCVKKSLILNIFHDTFELFCVKVIEQADGPANIKRLPLPTTIALPHRGRTLCNNALRPRKRIKSQASYCTLPFKSETSNRITAWQQK